jgi:hypothetical protein
MKPAIRPASCSCRRSSPSSALVGPFGALFLGSCACSLRVPVIAVLTGRVTAVHGVLPTVIVAELALAPRILARTCWLEARWRWLGVGFQGSAR